MNRGGRRTDVFVDDEDCTTFLNAVGDGVERFGCEVHGFALMPNHYHLLVRSVRGNLSAFMRRVGGLYTQRVNRRHGWDGPLFKGRFKSQLVGDDTYLGYLLAYLHLNPVRANRVNRPDEPSWTSHRAYVGLEPSPPWLSTSPLLDQLGGRDGVEDFVRTIHVGQRPWPDALDTASGWLVGGEATSRPVAHGTPARPMQDVAAVERAICEVTGATSEELRTSKKGPRANPARRFAVWAIRQSTALSYGEIAHLLDMSPNQVAKVVQRMRPGGDPVIDAWQADWSSRVDA